MNDDSPTPRTDALEKATHDGECLPTCDSFAHDEFCPYCNPDMIAFRFARELERELSAANAEVPRLRREVEDYRGAVGRLKISNSNVTVERDTLAARVAEFERDRERLVAVLKDCLPMLEHFGWTSAERSDVINKAGRLIPVVRSAIDSAADAAKDQEK